MTVFGLVPSSTTQQRQVKRLQMRIAKAIKEGETQEK